MGPQSTRRLLQLLVGVGSRCIAEAYKMPQLSRRVSTRLRM
jgi:hypothetical protein